MWLDINYLYLFIFIKLFCGYKDIKISLFHDDLTSLKNNPEWLHPNTVNYIMHGTAFTSEA